MTWRRQVQERAAAGLWEFDPDTERPEEFDRVVPDFRYDFRER